MKLIDSSVRELPQLGGWPGNVKYMIQDRDRRLIFSNYRPEYGKYTMGKWYIPGSSFYYGELSTLSCDHKESVVTRDEYNLRK